MGFVARVACCSCIVGAKEVRFASIKGAFYATEMGSVGYVRRAQEMPTSMQTIIGSASHVHHGTLALRK